ncbi:polysaccharide deacetylase family protein [Elizabethkingia ursingii]|uniref:polysaccharide deacetylase family protein n=2 Tax=Elizabethkingia TaxID=308865 RepID=UPI000D2FE2DE|nr:polysaccharide deacetylase family protein [Elizabethkingia ursingii]MCL1670907.1 polysaccharide deacetylase family protein [Elizabethkingia ursingii]PUB26405.1 polysaccharide deacetylase [Elizabethkingia sp. YR214]
MIYIILVLILQFLIIYFRIHLFLSPKERLIILMYHKIGKHTQDSLTVEINALEKQFEYLSKKKYLPIFFNEIHASTKKKIIISFDDGYRNNYEYLPKLLKKHSLKAVIFIPTFFIENGYNDNTMMSFDEIRSLPSDLIEIGLHSHFHRNFRTLSPQQADADIKTNIEILKKNQINYSKVFAYPYGKHIREKKSKKEFISMLKQNDIHFAVRIGNKINHIYNTNPFELCRIDIKGSDSMLKFKLKLLLGKLKFMFLLINSSTYIELLFNNIIKTQELIH